VVSDAGPLITLSRAGYLDLLPVLFGQIIVPHAVYAEVIDIGKDRPGARELRRANWLIKKATADSNALRVLKGQLGLGEAEAIVLAQELKADLLLLDDLKGRRLAALADLKVGGTILVLMVAVKRGLLQEPPEQVIEKLKNAGMYLSKDLVHLFIERAKYRTGTSGTT
jgi:predicted nucleic acid-binding protein